MRVIDLIKCDKCLAHFFESPGMVEACASVGIEHGKSSGQMLQEFYEVHHKKEGHGKRKAKR